MAPCQCCPACPHAASSRADIFCDRHPADAYLFEIHLYGQPEQLLHFYLMHKFGVSVQQSQIFLFVFLLAAAAGTLMGGPISIHQPPDVHLDVDSGDVNLLMPHVSLAWTVVLSFCVGLVLSSACPAILLYAQTLSLTS